MRTRKFVLLSALFAVSFLATAGFAMADEYKAEDNRLAMGAITMQQILQCLRLGWGQLPCYSREDLAFCLWTDLGDDFGNGTFRRKEDTLFA